MDDTQRKFSLAPIADALPYDEDFLYHLSRGSEFLIANRVNEAKEELERALNYQPEDAKGQDLLAGVYFRLGVYPRAIELWNGLVHHFPDDPALRVNLGLVLLKTGQPEEALLHLQRAVQKEPNHGRAWGYIGLSWWRLGRVDRARDAFAKGGQTAMARRMEEMLVPEPAPVGPSARELDGVRHSASVALEEFERDQANLVVDGRSTSPDLSSSWTVKELGAMLPEPAARGERLPSAKPVGALLEDWIPQLDEGTPFAVASGGQLFVRTRNAAVGRPTLLRARRATSARPASLESTSLDRQAFERWPAPVHAVLAASPGEVFVSMRLDGETMYLVEGALALFEEALEVELREVKVGGAVLRIVQLRGNGGLAFTSARAPLAIPTAGDPVHVDPRSLLGWTGRLFPGDANERGLVAFHGEGALLLA